MSNVKDIPAKDRPLSEQFRIVAKLFCDADAAASLMESLKTTTLEQKKNELNAATGGTYADNRLEREVKASQDWEEYIREMCQHRAKANLLKVKMEYIRMKFAEWRTLNANARAERQM